MADILNENGTTGERPGTAEAWQATGTSWKSTANYSTLHDTQGVGYRHAMESRQ